MRSTRLFPFVFSVVPALAFGCLDRPLVPITPDNTRVSVQPLRVKRIDKVDLLFVIDNSASMKDKQSELGRRIPELVSAITTPSIDPDTGRETRVLDVHVGVITSSLGSNGTNACHPALHGAHSDDRGRLLPRPADPAPSTGYTLDAAGTPVAAKCPTVKPGEPLKWVAEAARDASAPFVGAAGAKELQAAASCVVDAVGDDGCGFEATWEAAYRFLADPAPSASANASCVLNSAKTYTCSGNIVSSGLDTALLEQRAKFLRPDSLLAVVVLSDENDFSLRPEGRNWKPWSLETKMPQAWGGCANVPDDVEPDGLAGIQDLLTRYKCRSCEDDPSDPACSRTWPLANGDKDHAYLRGFHQVQRFGYNALFSRQRYVDAFSKLTVMGGDGKVGKNPIFAGGRSEDMIVVAGIVGVPEGLVAKDGVPKQLGPTDWEKLISTDLDKRDPHMIESFLPRKGIAEFKGDRAVDPISGGERALAADDLQYACIAKRSTPSGGEDCTAADAAGNPLCNGVDNQPYFKAYPGLRHLRILHDLDKRGFVGSICAESYSPAIRGIGERIRNVVDAQCIKTDITPKPSGEVGCFILETFAEPSLDGKTRCEDIGKGYCTPGAAPCRVEGTDYPPVAPPIAAAQLTLPVTVVGSDGLSKTQSVRASVEGDNVYAVGTDGKRHLVCEMMQLAGGRAPDADALSCRTDPKFTKPSTGGGWCYTDDPRVVGGACLDRGAVGKVRFLGDVEPKNGSEVFTVCVGH